MLGSNEHQAAANEHQAAANEHVGEPMDIDSDMVPGKEN
jgi:hypothetical protein